MQCESKLRHQESGLGVVKEGKSGWLEEVEEVHESQRRSEDACRRLRAEEVRDRVGGWESTWTNWLTFPVSVYRTTVNQASKLVS